MTGFMVASNTIGVASRMSSLTRFSMVAVVGEGCAPPPSSPSQHVLQTGYYRALGWGCGEASVDLRYLLCHPVRSTGPRTTGHSWGDMALSWASTSVVNWLGVLQ